MWFTITESADQSIITIFSLNNITETVSKSVDQNDNGHINLWPTLGHFYAKLILHQVKFLNRLDLFQAPCPDSKPFQTRAETHATTKLIKDL